MITPPQLFMSYNFRFLNQLGEFLIEILYGKVYMYRL